MGKQGQKLVCKNGDPFEPWAENKNVCTTCKCLKSKTGTAEEMRKARLADEVEELRRLLQEKEAEAQKLAQEEEAAKPEPSKKSKKKKEKEKEAAVDQIDTQPEQGCRDFPPEDYRIRNWLFSKFRTVAHSFSFEEYDAPLLEPENLYIVKAGKGDSAAGEEILDQMFNFTTKGGHKVALRPEMTPTLARLIMKKGQSLLLPIKWFSIPQCWRFEAIVRGRKREHYQWNMDIFGVPGVAAESELLSAIATFLKSLGLTSKEVGIKVNSRKLLQTVLQQAGVSDEQFNPVCIIIDKIDKLERSEIVCMLKQKGLTQEVIDKILATLEIKTIDGLEAVVGTDAEVVKELRELFDNANAYGFGDWLQFDASVVRGLAYYTGVVFEGFARVGELQRAICGGGRYDKLMQTFGHTTPIPACGFGFGDCVIVELLKDLDLLPKLDSDVQDIIVPYKEDMRSVAIEVCTHLRSLGRSVDIILDKTRTLKQAFSYADRRGADRVVLVAPKEWEAGNVRVKDLRDAEDDRGVEMSLQDLYKRS